MKREDRNKIVRIFHDSFSVGEILVRYAAEGLYIPDRPWPAAKYLFKTMMSCPYVNPQLELDMFEWAKRESALIAEDVGYDAVQQWVENAVYNPARNSELHEIIAKAFAKKMIRRKCNAA